MNKFLPVFLGLALVGAGCGNPSNETDGGTKAAVCGNGILEAGEACDDGNTSDIDSCRNDCALPSCGNGVVDPGEECDDGNHSNVDACTSVCLKAKCGDGFAQYGVEECDDGNASDTDTCRSDCKDAYCGDGNVQPGEACDDGNTIDGDDCTNHCTAPTCGDGVVQSGEQCDDGNSVNTDSCTNACKVAACGDGLVLAGVEQCDDGNSVNTDNCTNTCKLATCGDGFHQSGEECDDGNTDDTDTCTTACKVATCGDGFLQANEECDDGNTDSTDDCTSACAIARCGDGFTHATNEACDDGNQDNTDSCLDTCVVASCGDGFTQAGVEQCDDANNTNTDACLDTCMAATCGDGYVFVGTESCDPGGAPALCDSDCTPVICGDGLVNTAAGESCDDQNDVNSDGCTSLCVAQVNTPPVANDASFSTDEDTQKSITLAGSDPDGDPVSFTVVSQPQHGQLTGTGASLTYTPAADFNGPDSFTFTVNDGFADSLPATVNITVNPVNDPPVATAQSVTLNEDGSLEIALAGTDLEGDTLSFWLTSQPSHGQLSQLDNTTGKTTYTPSANFNGTDSFKFKVNDGHDDSLEATVTLTVTAVNDAPSATAQSVTIDRAQATTVITLAGTDVDLDPLTYALAAAPQGESALAHGTLSAVTGNSVTYTPTDPNQPMDDFFYFTVSDGQLTSTPAKVTLKASSPGIDWRVVSDGAPFSAVVKGPDRYLAVVDNYRLQTSTDGSHWTNLPYSIDGCGYINTLLYANNRYFLTCNNFSFSATSADGSTWTKSPQTLGDGMFGGFGPTRNVIGVTAGAGLFVAFGGLTDILIPIVDHTLILTSQDGLTWSEKTVPGADDGMAVGSLSWEASSGFVGTAANGARRVTSTDGLTWSLTTSSGSPSGVAQASSSTGVTVLVGFGASIFRSSDNGASWTAASDEAGNTNGLKAVAWDGSQFIAVGAAGTLLTSTDGDTWTARTSGTSLDLVSIAAESLDLLVVGEGRTALHSTDAAASQWTVLSAGLTPSNVTGLAYGNGTFVAVDGAGNAFTSADGETWTKHVTGSPYAYGLAFGDGRFVLVCQAQQGAAYTSTDGVSWGGYSTPNVATNITYAPYGGSPYFLGVGQAGVVISSTDSQTWTDRSLAGIGVIGSVAFGSDGNGHDAAVLSYQNGSFFRTTDGQAFTKIDGAAGPVGQLGSVTFSNGTFFAGSHYLPAASSSDLGLTWSEIPGLKTNTACGYGNACASGLNCDYGAGFCYRPLISSAWGEALFVGVGKSGNIVTSLDSGTWTPRTSSTLNNLDHVVYGDGKFVAVGEYGTFLVSP